MRNMARQPIMPVPKDDDFLRGDHLLAGASTPDFRVSERLGFQRQCLRNKGTSACLSAARLLSVHLPARSNHT